MTVLPISTVEPSTHKFRTIVEARDLGYHIPETYVVIPPVEGDSSFFESLEDCEWLIRPSVNEDKVGTKGGICSRRVIKRVLENVLSYCEDGAQIILQKYIQSDKAGIMVSASEVYIETINGANFGLTRAGLCPSTYTFGNGLRSDNIVVQPKKFIMNRAKYVEVPCNEESTLSKELVDALIEMAADFRSKIIEWCWKDTTLYFLEYWKIPEVKKDLVRGRISLPGSGTNDILVLPNANIEYYPLAMRARGIISKTGGYLSHLGIACLERGIPFVVADQKFREGEMVFVDGRTRNVTRAADCISMVSLLSTYP
jgi:phosphoenolpyruvate synthase/pyruvate phosphate dikinase